jgi:hypothetical protein
MGIWFLIPFMFALFSCLVVGFFIHTSGKVGGSNVVSKPHNQERTIITEKIPSVLGPNKIA